MAGSGWGGVFRWVCGGAALARPEVGQRSRAPGSAEGRAREEGLGLRAATPHRRGAQVWAAFPPPPAEPRRRRAGGESASPPERRGRGSRSAV